MTTRNQSSIGAAQHYGPRDTNDGLPNTVSTYGLVKQVELQFSYDQLDLPTENANVDAAVLTLPANAYIKNVYLYVETSFASGGAPTLNVGLQQTDGTVIDADGIYVALTVAELAAGWVDNSVAGNVGALVEQGIGANEAQIAIVGSAAYTAGVGRLVVEYMQPEDA